MHRVHVDMSIPDSPGILEISGDEAEHALRVKRLGPGDLVEVLDGRGVVARATILEDAGARAGSRSRRSEQSLRLRIDSLRRVPPIAPAVELCTATPKGPRADEMIDALAQIGVASWRPMHCARSVVDPREHKLERLTRLAREAGKQCGRAWAMTIDAPIDFAGALAAGPDTTLIVADATGESPRDLAESGRIRVLVGPEGGLTPDELSAARRAGARVIRLGPHTLRIETAAAAAAAVLLCNSTQQ